MDVRCPYCHDGIASRREAVRCERCAAPHHGECWTEHGGCSVHACGGEASRPFTRRAAARIVVGAGRQAAVHVLQEARDRLGAKATVGLLFLSLAAVALTTGWLSRAWVPTLAGRAEVALLGVFAVMAAWITALLYRGTRLADDLQLQVASTDLQAYYRRLWSGLSGEQSSDRGGDDGCNPGCGDLSGCAVDGEGLALIAAVGLLVVVLLLVGPLVAWLAVELLYPVLVISVYTVLYGALALAVHAGDDYRGRLLACLGRGVLFAALYAGLVAGVIELGRWLVGAAGVAGG